MLTPKVPNYVVGDALGSGAVARVFAARPSLDSAAPSVALKLALPGASEFLLREARLLGRLAPVGARARLLDAGWAGDSFYLVMPLVRGAPLSAQLSAAAPAADARKALFIAVGIGVARALAELHSLGYAHGDVKPENILVAAAEATLIDYGLAAPFGEPLTGGTPAYLAPNAALVAPENDLFALGCVLREIVVDHPLATALCSPSPGLRPSARAVLRALRGEDAGGRGSDGSVPTLELLRLAYLALRADEIVAGCTIEEGLEGPSRSWLEEAIAWEQRFATPQALKRGTTLGPLSPFRRRRWLISVLGYRAAGIDVSDEREDAFIARILKSESLPGGADVVPVVPAVDGKRVGLVARLVRGTLSNHEVVALEACDDLDPDLQLELARHLVVLGEFPRATLALRDRSDLEAVLLHAEIQRRSGAPRMALETLAAAAAVDPRALSLAARAHWDLGEDDAARALATRADDPEVLALLAYRASAYEVGEREVERGLLSRRAPRSRLLGIRGMLFHAVGRAEESMVAFAAALDASQSVLEEASYGTGLAAAASDAGSVRVSLDASTRSAFQWESLGRPLQAARALLARAATLLLVGSAFEARESLLATLALARRGGDALTECYAELGLAEVEDAAMHLDRAESLATVLQGEPLLRTRATRLSLLPASVAPSALLWGDEAAVGCSEALRLEWWGARARGLVQGAGTETSSSGALLVLRELSPLLDARASLAVRGPAMFAALALARALGETALAQRLSGLSATLATTFLADLPPRYRSAKDRLPWARAAEAEPSALSPVQMAEFSRIAARFGGRESLRELFSEVLDAMLLWTSAERGVVLTRVHDTLVPRTSRNLRREDLRGDQLVLSKSLAEEALRTRQPIVATDAFASLGNARASIHALKLRSVLAVPLLARGEVLGVVYLDDRARRDAFGPKELAWVSLLAVQAACAIADARDQLLLRRSLRKAERARAELAEVLREREDELAFAKKELREASRTTAHAYHAISGTSREMSAFLRLVDRVTDTDVPVLLLGESGTGKELVARAIHENGARSKHAFVTENCASVPENLLESTLFGHVRGAFTGASASRAGLLDLADRGTLFLDEIGEMPLGMQGKLLRVLQDGVVRPVGSDRTREVNVRIVAATHRDLPKMVKDGTFRADLFYRLDVATLRIPALRERADDIPGLVHHFIQKYGGGRNVVVTAAALKVLVRKPWPGNVRQLENEMRKLLLFAGDRIDIVDLSEALGSHEDSADSVDAFDLPGRVDALETELVQAALRKVSGNQTKAAELLRISRFGLQKMMKRLGIAALR